MFLIRRAKAEDVDTLVKLARMVHFINLPADREIISEKMNWSRNCFLLAADDSFSPIPKSLPKSGARKHASSNGSAHHAEHGALAAGIRSISGQSPVFMFVLEDTEVSGVVGTSQIISRMGGPGQPNVSLQLERREKFSQSLQMGVTHTVAKLHLDETGPTEIGGLILQPSYRGHRLRLGRFLAIVRFHFMGLHRELFSDRVLAEMMGPITADGENPFWDYCTRCFINMTYEQADKFCQQSKEFILSLFPREDIYLTLIAAEARAVVGQVGPETLPARRMLENLGFKCHNRVDPFDGGPHLEADMDSILPVAHTSLARLAEFAKDPESLKSRGIVSTLDEDGEFRAVEVPCDLDRSGRVIIAKDAANLLVTRPGAEVGFTPTSSYATKPALAPAPKAAKGPAPKKKPAKRKA